MSGGGDLRGETMRALIIVLLTAFPTGEAWGAIQAGVQVTGSALGDPTIAYPFDDKLSGLHPSDSPAVQREKSARLKVLKQECLRYKAADSGNISPYHLAVVRRKARDILSGSGRFSPRARTGSLVSEPPKSGEVPLAPC